MTAARREFAWRDLAADRADDGSTDNDRWEGRIERKDGDKRRSANTPQPGVLQRLRADAPCGEQHNGSDRWLDAIEQCGDDRHVAEGHVDPRQGYQDEELS